MVPSQETPQFVAPNACAHCKWEQKMHGICYSRELEKLHTYVAPSDAVRLERMKANRVLRQQSK